MMYLQGLLLALSALAQASQQADGPLNFTAIFSPVLSPDAEIILPTDARYKATNARWSDEHDPTYVVAIKPATEGDIQNIVRKSQEHGIPFLARGGGHGVKLGYANVRHAVNIDLSAFNEPEFDFENDLVTVGPGVVNSQIYDPVQAAGKELPISTDRCINTLGAAVGGGMGTLISFRGLMIDAMVSARIVTATGDLVTISKTENADLFWAVRGAGANFGIVTSATFRLYEQTNGGNSVFGDFTVPPEKIQESFELIRSVDEDLPQNVFWGILGAYNHTAQQPTVTIRFQFHGSEEDAQPHLDKLKVLEPIISSVKVVKWNELGVESDKMCNYGFHSNMYQIGLRRTDVETFVQTWNEWCDFSKANPWFEGMFMLERRSEIGPLAVPKEDWGVFPWRDNKLHVIFVNFFPNSTYSKTVEDFVIPARAKFQEVMGWESQYTYVNEAYGDEGAANWYGPHNLPRLVALKQKWDPNNQFGAGTPVPLSL